MLREIDRRLEAHYGATGWWPGDSPFEIAVGAILVQNTAWTNVEKAIANLKAAKMLQCRAIADAHPDDIEPLIRPSGYYRVKAKRLQSFCKHVTDHYNASIKRMAKRPLEELRPELLSIHGIGPETADCILLYACGKPVFVVDAYTKRILSRHELCEPNVSYEPLRARFEKEIQPKVNAYGEYHARLVLLGKDFCKTAPTCEGCPLESLLKNGQPKIG